MTAAEGNSATRRECSNPKEHRLRPSHIIGCPTTTADEIAETIVDSAHSRTVHNVALRNPNTPTANIIEILRSGAWDVHAVDGVVARTDFNAEMAAAALNQQAFALVYPALISGAGRIRHPEQRRRAEDAIYGSVIAHFETLEAKASTWAYVYTIEPHLPETLIRERLAKPNFNSEELGGVLLRRKLNQETIELIWQNLITIDRDGGRIDPLNTHHLSQQESTPARIRTQITLWRWRISRLGGVESHPGAAGWGDEEWRLAENLTADGWKGTIDQLCEIVSSDNPDNTLR